jgi:hypothetical protein
VRHAEAGYEAAQIFGRRHGVVRPRDPRP